MKRKVIPIMVSALSIITASLLAQQPRDMNRQHAEIMPLHAKVIAQQKAQDAEIDQLLKEMNSATGEKRVDAIAALINKLVEQRRAMTAELGSHLDR
jgi:phage shock protein A